LGGVAGGIFTSALISYGLWLLDLCDLRTAHRSMVAGAVGTMGGVAVWFGSQAAVVAFGTASTGTALSSLSGAVAAKATMAWFAGGAISAGGGGVAMGTIILTGGVAIVGIVLGAGVTFLFKFLDKSERLRLIHGRIGILTNRISRGIQPEWQTI
jgi:hypothetical protein